MTTILPDKTVNIPFGGVFTQLIVGLIVAALALGSFFLPAAFSFATWSYLIGWGIGCFLIFGIVCLPISVASDVGDRIPEIQAARKNNPEIKEIQIKHRYFGAIILLTILSFWSGFGWIVALAWACSPGKVVIPDKLFAAAFGRNQAPDADADLAPVVQPPAIQNEPVSTLQNELHEIARLHEAQLISDEEFAARRKLVLSR